MRAKTYVREYYGYAGDNNHDNGIVSVVLAAERSSLRKFIMQADLYVRTISCMHVYVIRR